MNGWYSRNVCAVGLNPSTADQMTKRSESVTPTWYHVI